MIKPILYTGIAIFLGSLAFSGLRAANTAMELETKILPRLKRLDWKFLELEIDAELRNELRGTFTLYSPFVTLNFAGREVFGVDLPEGIIEIRPGSTHRLSDPDQLGEPLLIRIPTPTLIELVPEVFGGIVGVLGGRSFAATLWFSGRFKAPNLPEIPFRISRKITIQSPVQ